MLKNILVTTALLINFIQPVIAKDSQSDNKLLEKQVQQQFNNVPTPIYFKYIDKNGLNLDSLIKYTISNNKQLLANQQQIQAGQGKLQQSGLLLNPEIAMDFSNNYILDREGEYDFGLTYTQPIELFGRRQSRYKVAELQLEAIKNEVQFEYVQLISNLKEEYINTLVEAENLKLTEQLLNLNKDLLELTQAKYTLGDVSKFDANLARIEVNRLKTQLITAENKTKNALIRLKAAAAININQNIKLTGNFYSTNLLPVDIKVESLQALAVQNRFDLKTANLNQEVSQATITQLQTENMPVFNLSGGYSRDKSIFDDTPSGEITDTDNNILIGLSMELPISNRNQGNISEAQAIQIQNQFKKEYLEQQIRRDVSIAFYNLQAAKNNIAVYDNQILKDAKENLWITRGIHQLGEQDLLYVIIEQTRLIDIQKEYIDVLREYNLSVIELERTISLPINSIIKKENHK